MLAYPVSRLAGTPTTVLPLNLRQAAVRPRQRCRTGTALLQTPTTAPRAMARLSSVSPPWGALLEEVRRFSRLRPACRLRRYLCLPLKMCALDSMTRCSGALATVSAQDQRGWREARLSPLVLSTRRPRPTKDHRPKPTSQEGENQQSDIRRQQDLRWRRQSTRRPFQETALSL